MTQNGATALKLKSIRERSGLALREVARRLGISPSTYGHYEDPSRFKARYLPLEFAQQVAAVIDDEALAAEVLALAIPTRAEGFEESGPQPKLDVLGALGARGSEEVHNAPGDPPGTIRLAVVGSTIQVAATVDADSFDTLIRRLELARQMIEGEP